MTRPIKFRAWDKKSKVMFDVTAISFERKDLRLEPELWVVTKDGAFPYSVEFDDFELMQFTGLLDKNGKEIYEGDLFKNYIGNDLWFWVVKYENLHACFNIETIPQKDKIKFDGSPEGTFMSLIEYYDMFNDFEVIGNIYENPTT